MTVGLELVFIGYNEHQTQRYFEEFKESNQEQIWGYDPIGGRIWMHDGTKIRRAPNSFDRLDGLRVDQVIVACDRRGVRHWPEKRLALLDELIRRASMSDRVLEEDRVIIYELDEREV